ncbi:DUF2971 domain-containing protein [Vibrio sp. 99-70-13A1]|uniref:DUF2971 domain-containing protein n=1 Tax=Vibrio sp. 99-70-13A1 TaxID=2607601 RepID=UPI0014934CC0|nr:DUF2971 domain-containing protein [Vibrio sp. 99-70-13A1]NOH99467.1 DUF2971 domain-containing protein [Vibrio sp. 99-70-13A1]
MKLFKFSNVDMNKLACLQSSHIWFASQGSCNDPFEGSHLFSEFDNYDESTKIMRRIVSQVISSEAAEKLVSAEHVEKHTKNEISEYQGRSVLSMSLSCAEKLPQFNNLMWSHYADAMKGYCLQFDKNSFVESIYNVGSIDAVEELHCDVIQYSENAPIVHAMDPRSSQQLIFSKSECWEYENEYRLTSKCVGKHSYDPKSLEKVILGFSMPIEQQLLIFNVISSNNKDVVFEEAVLKQGTYCIEFVDFDIEHKINILNGKSYARDEIMGSVSLGHIIRRKGLS